MDQRFADLTPEHLGGEATQATLDQFLRACDAAITRHQAILDWNEDGSVLEEGVIDFVWNDGDFAVRIQELLGEEIAQ